MLDYAIDRRMPVLGVCRGMQFLNVHFSGRLHRIESGANGSNRHVASTHTVRIVKDRYADLIGKSLEVNSFWEFETKKQDREGGETYFIIHPVLKHVAIVSCSHDR